MTGLTSLFLARGFLALPRRSATLVTLLACVAAVLACRPANAFLVTVHQEITRNALAAFPTIPQEAKRRIEQGSVDADLVEGALPVVRGPYDARFHFDNYFTYDAVLANFARLAALIDRSLASRQPEPWEFGKLLHAIEDFYSHSNYVLLYRELQRNRFRCPARSRRKFASSRRLRRHLIPTPARGCF